MKAHDCLYINRAEDHGYTVEEVTRNYLTARERNIILSMTPLI